jgi:hypothetical protein
MPEIKQAYIKLYRHELEQDLSSELSSYEKKFVFALLAGQKNENYKTNVMADVEALYNAGENKIGTNGFAISCRRCVYSNFIIQKRG